MVKKTVPFLLFALFHTLVDNKIENNIDICFLNLNGTFLCVTQKRKVPIEGWVKVDGIPPSYKAMAGQVGEAGKKVFPASPSSIINLYREQSLIIPHMIQFGI